MLSFGLSEKHVAVFELKLRHLELEGLSRLSIDVEFDPVYLQFAINLSPFKGVCVENLLVVCHDQVLVSKPFFNFSVRLASFTQR
jgi:hypothetical protein